MASLSQDPYLGKTFKAIVLWLMLGLVLLCAAFSLDGIILNWSHSLPRGAYILTVDGQIAQFCPTEPYGSLAIQRGYRDRGSVLCDDHGVPLLKPIVARAGDRVETSAEGVLVNSVLLRNSAPRTKDTGGRSIPHHPYGRYEVQPGTVWVISSYDQRSFDSRYFGPVELSRIQGYYRPLLVAK